MMANPIPVLRWPQILARDAVVGGFMILVAMGIGLIVNTFREKPLPLIYQTKAERLERAVTSLVWDDPASPNRGIDHPAELSLEDFWSFVEQKKGLILDTRPAIFYRLGHVPGAVSLPRETFDSAYPQLQDILEKDKDQPLVLYCSSPSCEDSRLVQNVLSKLGYSKVCIFADGWEAWTRAELKEEIQP